MTIGAWINNGVLARQWLGQIDEVRLYNRALSAGDVAELYGFTLTNFNSRPTVTVPGSLVLNSAPTNIQLTATVSDDGNPLPANPGAPDLSDPHKLRWWWSVVSPTGCKLGCSLVRQPNQWRRRSLTPAPRIRPELFLTAIRLRRLMCRESTC